MTAQPSPAPPSEVVGHVENGMDVLVTMLLRQGAAIPPWMPGGEPPAECEPDDEPPFDDEPPLADSGAADYTVDECGRVWIALDEMLFRIPQVVLMSYRVD